MRRIYTLGLIVLLTGILSKSYATDGCYSTFTSRFYYISIGTNNYSGFTYAMSGSTLSCSTFTSGSYDPNSPCMIEGTSSSSYRQATTNLIYPCPIDDYIPFLMLLLSGLGLWTLRSRSQHTLKFSNCC
jgi:hypothetical protein